MAVVSRRILANAVAARLTGVTNATCYYGQVGRLVDGTLGHEPPLKGGDDLRVKSYLVLFPGTGHPGPDPDLGDQAVDVTLPLPVTAVAGDVEDLLGLVDRVTDRLYRWTPVVDGLVCGPVGFPVGYVSGPILPDRDFTPERLFTRLPFQVTATQ